MAMTPLQHAAGSAHITRHLDALLTTFSPRTLGFCAPLRNEFDVYPLLPGLLARGWRAAMPVVNTRAAPLTFRLWQPGCAMTTDLCGIPVPTATGGAVIEAPSEITPDLLLLPLVAFDAQGYRLGYGGGYFDRTLAASIRRPQAIGVGFELGRVPDIRPQAHDIRLDAVVTEAGVFRP